MVVALVTGLQLHEVACGVHRSVDTDAVASQPQGSYSDNQEYIQTACMDTGVHTLHMQDSFGDGWNGASWNVFDHSFSLTTGSSGSESFAIPGPPSPP